MATPKPQQALEHFTRLNPAVYIHQPTSNTSSRDPDLIVLATWMDASIRNVAKYAAGYEALYPSARILLITTTTPDAMFRSNAANLNRIAPVLEVLQALPPNARFLIHSFSNGGAMTISFIAKEFQAKTGRALPATALILDSAPGRASYSATVRAFAVALPKFFILRWIGTAIIAIVFWMLKFSYWVKAQPDAVEQIRRYLNMARLFGMDTPRLYIYSVKDDIVAWQDVEEHVEEAKGLGYKVDSEKFLDTAHSGHLIRNEGRYWAAVKRLWSSAA